MNFDTKLFFLFNNLGGQSAWFDRVIVFCAEYLPYIIVVVVAVWLLFINRGLRLERIRLTTALATSLVVSMGITVMIRLFYHHPRPFVVLNVHQLIAEHSWSFPSQHATFFFALAIFIYQCNRQWGTVLIIAAFIISLARVVAGVHYPLDIGAGAILGSVIAILIYRLFLRNKKTSLANW